MALESEANWEAFALVRDALNFPTATRDTNVLGTTMCAIYCATSTGQTNVTEYCEQVRAVLYHIHSISPPRRVGLVGIFHHSTGRAADGPAASVS